MARAIVREVTEDELWQAVFNSLHAYAWTFALAVLFGRSEVITCGRWTISARLWRGKFYAVGEGRFLN